MIKSKDYVQYGSYMRSLAILCVITIHSVTGRTGASVSFSDISWIYLNFLNIACHWGVPVFFMLSGAILIGRCQFECAPSFYRKRFKKIIPAIFFWSFFYIVFNSWLSSEFNILSNLLLIMSGRPEFHLWFLFAIFFLYISVPFISLIYKYVNDKERLCFVLFFLIISSASAILWIIKNQTIWRLPPNPVFTIEWFFYLGYFLIGYELKSVVLSKIQIYIIFCIFCIFCIFSFFILYYSNLIGQFERGQGLVYCYLSPLVIVESVSAYVLILNTYIYVKKYNFLWDQLSEFSFGIYLIHILILRSIEQIFKWEYYFGNSFLSFFVLILAVFLTSFLMIFFISKIKYLKITIGL